ncbi:MAG TPA: sugar ABC transporter ATP-binding protein, partial [Roseiarcus sp.]|nr:sugar ABC transporter ATP-binding protein [Roseiarcus sp.]
MAETLTARIEMLGVSKSFPGVRALDHVDFSVQAGEVHALMGENGAGKSTLIKIMTGAIGRDEGEILIDGRPVEIGSPGEARALGVSAVYQEVNLIPTMSVTRNLTLGRQPRRFGLVSWRAARDVARERLERLKIDIDVERPLGSYSLAVQQLVAIARALEADTRILVLDEPTASLDANETELLFQILRDLKDRGIAIVFITHFLDQVYKIADRISVLRNGQLVGTAAASELPRLKLISMMLGRELEETEERLEASPHGAKGEPILVAEGLGRRRVMAPFDLSLKAGEVVGLAGLLGSGRTEAAKLIFGAIRPDSGRIEVGGAAMTAHSPSQSLRHGMAFCPEDRKAEGIFGELSVRENIILGLQTKRGWLARLSRAEQDRLAQEMIETLGIATPDADKPVGQLSGGNQQKVVLARSLVSGPSILILDEPTRG